MRIGATAVTLLVAVGCGAPDPPPSTGGTDTPGGPCGRGFVVVRNDDGFQSTSVSLVDPEGAVLSARLISSGTASAGLSAALSGDVVVPSERRDGDELLLIDRFPAAVLTWLEVATGDVRAQLDVRTGFLANPQDALRVGDDLWVSRYGSNRDPGREPFDAGGDVLVVDPAGPSVRDRIDLSPAMADAPGFLPRSNRLLRLGDDGPVLALLGAYDQSFSDAAPSRLAILDPTGRAIVGRHVLPDLFNCNALVALDNTRVAVGCTGLFANFTSVIADLSQSGIAVLRYQPDTATFVEERRWTGDDLGGPIGQNLEWAPPLLLTVTYGETNDTGDEVRPDRFITLDPETSEVTMIRQGRPFSLGDVRCALAPGEACGGCLLTDAAAGVLRRYTVLGPTLDVAETITVDDGIGLPPRYLGRF